MANYKVPQDVEAEDKLLGPFTFRQFVYLMVVFGAIVLAVGLFQIFPLLAVIPVPFGLFFLILALPIKKDQPMETYLAAVLTYHLKPKKRLWMPGQSESTILITAPKKVEPSRVRNITEEEASHRLSFLASLVDTEGRAIKSNGSAMRDEFYAEAYNTTDMFDRANSSNLSNMITREQQAHHAEIVSQMRAAIQSSAYNFDQSATPASSRLSGERVLQPSTSSTPVSPSIVQPTIPQPTAPQPTTPQPADHAESQPNPETYISLR